MTDAPAGPARELRIPLDPPVKFGEETYDELVLREPTVAEVEKIDDLGGTAWNRALIASVAGVPDKVISKLGIRTMNTAAAYLVSFTGAVLPTATAD